MTSHPFDLTGRVALVTGANTGLGQALALALAQAGADIAVAGRSSAEATGDAVRAAGRRFHDVRADLGDVSVVGDVVADAETALGPVDILVNNAGTIRRQDALEFSESDWDDVMNVNLKSLFFLTQAAGRSALRRPRRQAAPYQGHPRRRRHHHRDPLGSPRSEQR